VTRIQEKKSVRAVARFVAEHLAAGRQAYIVFPLIDESETVDAGAALTGLKEWTGHLQPHSVGLLHGRMNAEEKDAVMRRFRDGEVRALVSTTVIEVGVDVPNATVMVIHNAERFGLAQLHQLRGRIGRGAHESQCVLLIPDKDTEARQRLEIMEQTCDGFRIAEEDLRRRGPGDLLGQAQSGQAPLRFAELLADTRLLTLARRLAERTLQADPSLTKSSYAALNKLLGDDDSEASALQ
jgi:ATP-dependent DNA helicase RecG